MPLHMSPNLFMLIPLVAPSFTGGMWLLVDAGDYKLDLDVNSNLVASATTSKILQNFLLHNTFFNFSFNILFVRRIVKLFYSIRNEKKK